MYRLKLVCFFCFTPGDEGKVFPQANVWHTALLSDRSQRAVRWPRHRATVHAPNWLWAGPSRVGQGQANDKRHFLWLRDVHHNLLSLNNFPVAKFEDTRSHNSFDAFTKIAWTSCYLPIISRAIIANIKLSAFNLIHGYINCIILSYNVISFKWLPHHPFILHVQEKTRFAWSPPIRITIQLYAHSVNQITRTLLELLHTMGDQNDIYRKKVRVLTSTFYYTKE